MNTVAAKIPSVFHRNVDAEGKKKRGEHERSFNNKEKNPGCTTPNPHPTTTPKPTHNPTPNDLHTPPKPEHRPKYLTPRKHPHPKLLPSTKPIHYLSPKMPTLLDPPPLPNPGPSTPPPKIPTPNPTLPLPPSPPPQKKKKIHWRGGVSLRSRSGHPGVGSWGAETNPPLGGHPGVGAKSGGEGRRSPFFSVDDPERTRNETA